MAEKRSFTIDISANIANLQRQVNTAKSDLSNLLNVNKVKTFNTELNSIEKVIQNIQTKANQKNTSLTIFDSIDKDLTNTDLKIKQLLEQIKSIQSLSFNDRANFLDDKTKTNLDSINEALENYEKNLSKIKNTNNDLIEAQNKLQKKNLAKNTISNNLRDEKKLLNSNNRKLNNSIKRTDEYNIYQQNNKEVLKWTEIKRLVGLRDSAKKISDDDARSKNEREIALRGYKDAFTQLSKLLGNKVEAAQLSSRKASDKLTDSEKTLNSLKQPSLTEIDYKKELATQDSLKTSIQKNQENILKYNSDLQKAENEVDAANQEVINFQNSLSNLNTQKAQEAFTKLKEAAKKTGIDISNIGNDATKDNVDALKQKINEFKNQLDITQQQSLSNIINSLQQLQIENDNTAQSVNQHRESEEKLNESYSNTQAIVERIKAFVGLKGAMVVMRKATQNAIRTVSELDKQMTEMAVVTDLKVGDYWKQLPQYTENANKLGVAIKDIYEASTLYYQQGLKTNEVQQVSNATLKLARIAGLSAEQATNKMTAALRGFNMEVNEANANNIADVYSKLAAITASDTNEISSAMTKTASLAHNAGMEFETTAAFLSQIIETTRESAETAGTALKTVIARFQELKKSPAEIGEVEGETVDANKIEGALRTVGVALRDNATGEFRALDEVFLELSQKWQTLDINTQRYIATIAAGSRQQSRFIAMMSDYNRTQELVTAANNAAGASNEQFGKTLDSLESKLAQLKNSWDSFSLSIINSDVIKFIVDGGNAIISVINGVTDSFGAVGGAAAKIGLVTAALKSADVVATGFKDTIGKEDSGFFKSLGAGFKNLGKDIKEKSNSIKIFFTFDNTLPKDFSKQIDEYKKEINDLKIQASQTQMVPEDSIFGASELSSIAINDDYAQLLSDLVEKEAEYFTQHNINQDLYNVAKAKGVTNDEAAILARSNLTEEEIEGLTIEQAVEKAKELSNKITSESILITYSEWVAKKLNIDVTRESTEARGIEKLVIDATNGSLKAQLILLGATVGIVLVLVGVIALLVFAFKQWQKNSPEGKLKAAQEALQQVTEEANNAKEAFEKLTDSLNGLDEAKKKIDALTEGTKEWREAVKENNQQIMDFIEANPEYADKFSWKNGVISLNEGESFDQIKAGAEKKKDQLLISQYQEEIRTARASTYKEKDELETKHTMQITVKNESGTSVRQGYTSFDKDDIISQIQSGEIKSFDDFIDKISFQYWGQGESVNYSDQYKKLFIDDIEVKNDLSTLYNQYKNVASTIDKNNTTIKNYSNMIATSIVDIVDTTSMTNDQIVAANNYLLRHQFEIQSETNKIYNNFIKREGDEISEWKEYWEKQGWTVDGAGGLTKDGQSKDEVAAVQEFAAAKVAETFATKIEKLIPDLLEKEYKLFGSEITNRFNSDAEGNDLTRSDAETILGKFDDYLMFNTSGEKDVDATIERFANINHISVEEARQLYETAEKTEELVNKVLSETNLTGLNNLNVSRNSAELLNQTLFPLINGLGKAGAQQIVDLFNNIIDTNSLNTDQIQKLVQQFALLDTTSIQSIDQFYYALREVGVEFSDGETSVQEFQDALKKLGKAVIKVDLETLTKNLQKAQSTILKMQTGEQGRTISQELYDQIVKQNPLKAASFVQNLDGDFTYLGKSILGLIDVINQSNKLSVEQLRDNLQQSKKIKGYLQNSDYSNININNKQEQADFLQKFASEYGNEINLRQIDDQFSIETQWTNDLIDQVWAKLGQYYNNFETEKEQQKIIDSLVQSKLTTQVVMNSYNSSDLRKNGIDDNNREEILATTEAIIEQARLAGISEILISDYAEKIERLATDQGLDTEATEKLNEELDEFEQKVANTASIEKSTKALQENISTISELIDKYEKLKNVNDLSDLTNDLLYKSLESFGINQNAISGLQDSYVDLLKGVFQGVNGREAVYTLIYAGLYDQIDKATLDAFKKDGKISREAIKGFEEQFDNLVNKGWLKFEDSGDTESPIYRLYSDEAYKAMAEMAGTVPDNWENPYNWLYNLNRKINDELKERERLERKFQLLLKNENSQYSDIRKNILSQIDNLNEQLAGAQIRATNALKEIELRATTNIPDDFKDLIKFDDKTLQIYIDWAAADAKGFTADQGSLFEEYVDDISSFYDEFVDANDTIEDIEDEIIELKDLGKNEFIDLENQIKEALINKIQKNIDIQQDINDSVSDADTKLADYLSEIIEEERKIRDNQKTEKEITDTQARINFLSRDTSGGNQTEILQLQKQLDEQVQGYQDTLIDQSIQNLQDQNEKAAEQRQNQIDIATAQLDIYSKSKDIWNDVDLILGDSLSAIYDGNDIQDTKLGDLLDADNGYTSYIQKQVNLEELSTKLKSAAVFVDSNGIEGTFGTLFNDNTNFSNRVSGLLGDTAKTILGENGLSGLGKKLEEDITANEKSLKDKIESTESEIAKAYESTVNTFNDTLSGFIDTLGKGGIIDTNLPKIYDIIEKSSLGDGYFQVREEETESYKDKWNKLDNKTTSTDISTAVAEIIEALPAKDGDEGDTNPPPPPSIPPTTRYDIMTTSGSERLTFNEVFERDLNGLKSYFMDSTDSKAYEDWKNTQSVVVYKDSTDNKFYLEQQMLASSHKNSFEFMGKFPYAEAKILFGNLAQFASGGLANFTGPAWLDGTAAHPEMVLNAKDTENFIQLRDVLGSLMQDVDLSKNKDNGDNYYDVDVNVESIDDDYDVEQLVVKIKKLITQDAMYRNVNAIQNIK